MSYEIFGKTVEINFYDESARKILEDELSLYHENSDSPDLIVNFREKGFFADRKGYYNSPGIFFDNKKEDVFSFGNCLVEYKKVNKTVILEAAIMRRENIKGIYKKFKDIGYLSDIEKAGQILHEIILIPAVLRYYSSEMAPLHGSVLYDTAKERGFVLSGTGGVGKTSTQLRLMLSDNRFMFLADDIGIVDQKGYAFGNYNFPKIYGYNTDGFPSLKSKLLQKEGITGKLQWELRYKKNKSRVRRRISPLELYGNRLKSKCKINTLFYLQRTNVERVNLIELESEKMAEILRQVIINEYYPAFFKYLRWKYINNLLDNEDHNELKKIEKNILAVYSGFLNQIDRILLVEVPYKISLIELAREIGESI